MVYFVVFFYNGRFFFCFISIVVLNFVRVMFVLIRLIVGNLNNYKIIIKKKVNYWFYFIVKKKNIILLSIFFK